LKAQRIKSENFHRLISFWLVIINLTTRAQRTQKQFKICTNAFTVKESGITLLQRKIRTWINFKKRDQKLKALYKIINFLRGTVLRLKLAKKHQAIFYIKEMLKSLQHITAIKMRKVFLRYRKNILCCQRIVRRVNLTTKSRLRLLLRFWRREEKKIAQKYRYQYKDKYIRYKMDERLPAKIVMPILREYYEKVRKDYEDKMKKLCEQLTTQLNSQNMDPDEVDFTEALLFVIGPKNTAKANELFNLKKTISQPRKPVMILLTQSYLKEMVHDKIVQSHIDLYGTIKESKLMKESVQLVRKINELSDKRDQANQRVEILEWMPKFYLTNYYSKHNSELYHAYTAHQNIKKEKRRLEMKNLSNKSKENEKEDFNIHENSKTIFQEPQKYMKDDVKAKDEETRASIIVN